jgi:N-acetylglucosamine kinase-like BadF-type ATPase
LTYLIGLDGGGTKTAGMLCDGGGRVLARRVTDGSAIVGLPPPEVCDALSGTLDRLCADAGVPRSAVDHVALGLSGVDFDDEIPAQHRSLQAGLGLDPDTLTLVNDGVSALWGVSTDARLALIQHGTGVTSAYRHALGKETVFDSLDVAAVYDVRRHAFAETARMIDGRAERTGLADRMLAHCGVTADAFAEWAFRRPLDARRVRATCAQVVFDAWSDGDSAAGTLVGRAARDYVITARTIGDRLGRGSFAVGFGGGVILQGGARFIQTLGEVLAELCPRARLTDVALPPEAGALILAVHRTGGDVPATFEFLKCQLSPHEVLA